MQQPTLARQRLTAVFLAGVLFLYSPVVILFDQPAEWLGIPVLYLYLFVVWAALIALMGWIVERQED